MTAEQKYACPECGGIEFITSLNSYDRYEAINGGLHWQKTELSHEEFKLYCRECSERAPAKFEEVAG